MSNYRYLKENILEDLQEKMVFVGGPRQVGKTTMAFSFLEHGDENHPAYLNWDFPEVRPALIKGHLPADQNFLILDEIHKYKNWRNLVKGFYDKHKSTKKFLITGSAKLDYYRRGGDSLQGRYYYYRLHPFSLMEYHSNPTQEDLNVLLKFGGFPETLFKQEERHWKRWQRDRLTRVIKEDLISLEQVKEVSQLELLAITLPNHVGSPLSVNSLREDLLVSFETVERWLTILENLYFCYRILPYGPPRIRAAKKEKKLYLWDWSSVLQEGYRFENFVASQLLKYCHYLEDTQGDTMELRFLRDSEKREIDFVIIKNKKPLFAVECKTGEKSLSKNIAYFLKRVPIPQYYQVHLGQKDVEIGDSSVRVIPFIKFCEQVLKI